MKNFVQELSELIEAYRYGFKESSYKVSALIEYINTSDQIRQELSEFIVNEFWIDDDDLDILQTWEMATNEEKAVFAKEYADAVYRMIIFDKIRTLCKQNNVSHPNDIYAFYNQGMGRTPSY